MDAFTEPGVERITLMKSARVGYTKIINNCIAYHIHLAPCNILVVQPTIEDANGYSKDEIAPMLRDTPALFDLVAEPRAKSGDNTILKKTYPGGILYLVGANSPRGFRRISARVVLFDETDGYPVSAGTEGDQIKLGMKRAEHFWDKLFVLGSTPTIKGQSKIETSYENSDQRRFEVPCPHCGDYQVLKWSGIQWPEGEPAAAYYACEHNGCVIEHSEKFDMITRGRWTATQPFTGHAGFHIWAAYSFAPNAAWGILAKEWLDCQRDTEALQTFVNTTLGETWEEIAERLDHAVLMKRAEQYDSPASGALVLTCGVDVQKEWLEVGIEGWNETEENWQVDYLYIYGNTELPEVWADLSAALSRTYTNDDGAVLPISCTCIDSGYNTDIVYSFCKKNAGRRVFATKGQAGPGLPIVDRAVKKRTGRDPRPVRRFNVGVDGAKTIIYHRLNTETPGPGYRHFPDSLQAEYYEGLTAEKVVSKKRRGFEYREWVKIRPRNEPLDIAVLNLAALKILNPTFTPQPVEPAPAAAPSSLSRRGAGGLGRR